MVATKKLVNAGTVLAKLDKAAPKNITLLRLSLASVTQGLEQMAQLLSKPEVPATVLAAAYNLIDGLWTKVIKDQREVVRHALMSLHENTESTELTYNYDGKTFVSTVTERRGKDPEWLTLLGKAQEKGLKPEDVSSQMVSTVYDYEKARKHFTDEELDAMRPGISKSLSLKVR